MTAGIATTAMPASASENGALGGPSPNIALMVGSGPGCQFLSLQAAIDFAATQPGADTVVATRSRSYSAIALTVADAADLTVMGGFDSCLGARDREATELDGTGGLAAPVIRHSGNGALNLVDLTIARGDSIDAGGGVDSSGSGSLRLENVALHSNRGVAGGGLAAIGADAASPKTVRLAGDVSFIGNIADSGGGAFLRNARLIPEAQPDLQVWENVAEAGDGGGLYLLNADIQSPEAGSGFGCGLRIFDNRASDRGGGLFLHTRGAEREIMLRVARDCMGGIDSNRAGDAGGGVYVLADAGFDAPEGSTSRLDLYLFAMRIGHNIAPEGSALMLRTAQTALRVARSFVKISPEDFGEGQRSHCDDPPLSVCSRIDNNQTLDAQGNFVGGAAIRVSSSDSAAPQMSLQISGTALIDNGLGKLIHVSEPETALLLADSLVNGPNGDEVIRAERGARATVARSTIVYPTLGSPVLVGDRHFTLEGSIVIVPERPVLCMEGLDNEGRIIDLMYDFRPPPIVCERPEFVGDTVRVTDPGFVDPDLGDFRLRADSSAIDRHEIIDPDQLGSLDLDGNPRGRDEPLVPNRPDHVWDLGAYEYVRLLEDGFEDP